MPTTGPSFPTVATGNTNTIGAGTRLWTNPTNIELNDASNATVSFLAAATKTDDLIGTGFGFSITSSDTINGILLEIQYGNGTNGITQEFLIQLLKAGVAVGSNKSTSRVFDISPTMTTISYGSAADLWGTTWTPADINNANFGAVFVSSNGTGGVDGGAVNFFRITITSTSAAGSTSQMMKMFQF